MYVPEIFKRFNDKYPQIAEAYKKAGDLSAAAGPMDAKAQHLIKLAVSVGTESKGGVRSHARRALEAGASEEEVVQTVLLAGTITGFPSMMAAYGWVEEVLAAR
jgi:AhpD family alkylhydroperoxidase